MKKFKNKKKERQFLKELKKGDWTIILDEKGKSFDSYRFSKYINLKRSCAHRRMVFVVGGPYGFSDHCDQGVKKKLHYQA